MRLFRHLFSLLVLLAVIAYSVEATLPAISGVVVEKSSEETEAKEEIESLVPAQNETKRVPQYSTPFFQVPVNVKCLSAHSGEQLFVKPSRIIFYRKLLI